ncbi:hypothetical protein F4604DRAFT_1940928 [Suillus subluteus]|nr:hypothetical protein F4604DRAFT_1940928 [Suillus subluteus]
MSDSLPTDSELWQNQYCSSDYNQIVDDPPWIESINRDSDVHNNLIAGHTATDLQVNYYGHGDCATRNDGDQSSIGLYHPAPSQTDLEPLSMDQSFTSHNPGGLFQDPATDHGQQLAGNRYTDHRLQQAHHSNYFGSIGTQDHDGPFLGQLDPPSQYGSHGTDDRYDHHLQVYTNTDSSNVQLECGQYVSQLEQPPAAAQVQSLPSDGLGNHNHYTIAGDQHIAASSHNGHHSHLPQIINFDSSNVQPGCSSQPERQPMPPNQLFPQDSARHYGHPLYHSNIAEVQQVPASCSHPGYSHIPAVDNMNYSNLQPDHGHYNPQPKQPQVVQSLPSDGQEHLHHDRSQFPVADGDNQLAGSSHDVQSRFRPYPEAQWRATMGSRHSDINLESM